ncbi:OmpA family protein [Pseudoprimorskyibacter insulae]|uniref:Outer membrane porin F n=1 Tax=Pseudoprimorskyibacter insulae TaxID=1695997 RepID=A0A2R8AV19_9RHOB|nr:OmpA family protein [Pseudoprimorskyibacter insulae]SPF79734.1 Outer membrane porin F [Pseudoprimorskyibacter insulae]
MRLSLKLLVPVAFLSAGTMAVAAAYVSSLLVEDISKTAVRSELDRDAITWAGVDTDGLQVYLNGTAPNEAARFQALTAAGRAVDSARVLDQMNVEESAGLTPPRFSIEVLRNDAGLSLIGLVPASMDRDALMAQIERRVGKSVPVQDFLETADFPEPETWQDAIDFAMISIERLPRSKISVSATTVDVTAMTDSAEDKERIEAELTRRTPEGVTVDLDLIAPRPVITPFTMRFVIDEDGPRFDACSAGTEASRQRILAAAAKAGLQGEADCLIGLGAPSRSWPDASELSIAALAELGGGSVTISDADISLVANQGTDPDLYARVVGGLDNALPDAFVLTAVLPEPPAEAGAEGPVEFVASLSPEGNVQMRGVVNSEMARVTTDSFARARFGSENIRAATKVKEGMDAGWSIRVLAGLEALARLSNGAVVVTPDTIKLRGNTGNESANAEIAGLLSEKLPDGADFEIDVTYQERLDPLLGIPTPEECEKSIVEIIGARKISFEPGAATFDAEADAILDDLAELLTKCGEIPLEIGGHTDSQGRESMNQQLSQSRAQAVLDALHERRVLTSSYTAVGFGEAQPIADNGTDAGREANRRIEFRLIQPEADTESALESDAQTGEETTQPAEDSTDNGQN